MKREDPNDGERRLENSMDLDLKFARKVYINQKCERDFDLNVAIDHGSDLNKFTDDEEEDFHREDIRQTIRIMMKIYLPNFY